MDEKKLREFSWTELFIVTSLCFFAFSAILEFLNHTYPDIFIWIGGISLILSLINAALIYLSRASSKGKHKLFP